MSDQPNPYAGYQMPPWGIVEPGSSTNGPVPMLYDEPIPNDALIACAVQGGELVGRLQYVPGRRPTLSVQFVGPGNRQTTVPIPWKGILVRTLPDELAEDDPPSDPEEA